MSIEAVRAHLESLGLADRIVEFPVSSATVDLAAQAAGVAPGRIAKTLSFKIEDRVLLILAAGDARVDNKAYKAAFHAKAKMLTPEETLSATGHAIGGVCPFGLPEGHAIEVYTDVSLRRFATVFPACGSSNSAIELSPEALYTVSQSRAWVDVCKGWREADV